MWLVLASRIYRYLYNNLLQSSPNIRVTYLTLIPQVFLFRWSQTKELKCDEEEAAKDWDYMYATAKKPAK